MNTSNHSAFIKDRSYDQQVETSSIIIPGCSLFDRLLGRRGHCHELPLAPICDYKETCSKPFYRGLTLYVFDECAPTREWIYVKKLNPINTIGLPKDEYKEIMKKVKEATEAKKRWGVRIKNWFYPAINLSSDTM